MLITQWCLTLCDLMDCSPLGSSLHEILQARILEWISISFSSNLPDPGTELESPALLAVSVSLSYLGSPVDALEVVTQLPQY